jgi:hypothetical protein
MPKKSNSDCLNDAEFSKFKKGHNFVKKNVRVMGLGK